MRTFWHFLRRTILWGYDRGTVPYDLMVIAILLFVFLSPRAWFNDRPGPFSGEHASAVEVVGEDPAAGTRTYRVDAHLLAPAVPDPQWERGAHNFLSKNVESLRNRHFRIDRVETFRNPDGSVLYYDIAVKQ